MHVLVFGTYSNSMMERLKTIISLIIIIIFLPFLVTFVVQGDFLNQSEQEDTSGELSDPDTEQLVLILAHEMPVSYEEEALTAQAVIARTNLLYAREKDGAEPESISRDDMREQLGAEEFQKCYERLKSCVEDTVGEVVSYKNKIVQLPYHFASAGKTRDIGEVDDDDSMPYLKAAASVDDLQSERFLKIEFISKTQFRNKLKEAFPDLEFPEKDINKMASVSRRDSSSYVLIVDLPGHKVSGEEIRNVFSLNSACFSIKEVDGQVRIVTKGYGQGYGMSQYGANEMAKQGSTYKEILKHYYHGIKVGPVLKNKKSD